jgi:hypothetical protein
MNCALLIGREGSVGFPGKNLHRVLGRPLMTYPLLAARGAGRIDRIYVSTDSPTIKRLAVEHGAEVIERPPELCTKEALGEDAFAHGYRVIRDRLAQDGQRVHTVTLLFCNAATVLPSHIDGGIDALSSDPLLDSAVTVSCYNMWSPLRARRVGDDGLLHPFVPLTTFGDPATLNCDRDSQGDVWFADMSVSIVRPHCLEHLASGMLPQKWMGQRILPIRQWGGLDVDFEWQIPQVEFWLTAHGFTADAIPYAVRDVASV